MTPVSSKPEPSGGKSAFSARFRSMLLVMVAMPPMLYVIGAVAVGLMDGVSARDAVCFDPAVFDTPPGLPR